MSRITNPHGQAAARAAEALRLHEEDGATIEGLATRFGLQRHDVDKLIHTAREFRKKGVTPPPYQRGKKPRGIASERANQAYELSAQGMTREAIAKQMGATEGTVRNWVEAVRVERRGR